MSADQRKKQLSSANVFGYSSREQYRAKKKHLSSSQFDLNWKLNSDTPLKWDDNEKRAVAKGEQIGLSKRDLRPFKAPASHHNNSLADVSAIPKDVFELDDLADVLSYEVWQSILSDKERSHLTQFLPRGVNPDEVVQDLLAGENLHFGNQFLKWSSMLCSGELHPEAVLHYDEISRANRNAYYSELQKYHDNMIRNLQKLKDRCAKDPEAEIEQMMWRTRKQPGKEVRHHNREQCVAADEKAWSSDNQSPLKARGELLRRKDTRKDKDGKQVGSLDVMKSKPKKKEKFPKAIVNNGDGSKYMSYVKISKSQHELVRSMKQAGNSIQSKALNRVIGNLTSFNVKPYVMFEEEEQKRIEDYWSNLAKKEIPSAFSKWETIQSERGEIMNSLCLEIGEKHKHPMEEEETDHFEGTPYHEEGSVSSDESEQTQEDEAPPAVESASDDVQDSDPSSSPEEQSPLQMPSLDVNQFSEEQQASLQIPSLDVNQKCIPMDLNEEDNHISPKSNEDESCSASESPEKKTSIDIMVNQEVLHSSARDDAWPTMAGSGSSFCSSAMDYASCSSMPLKILEPIEHRTAQLMDLESSTIPEVNPSKSMLPQQSDQLPFFGSYQTDNYHEEPKKIPLGFHPTTSLLIEPGPFPSPSFPLEPRRVQSDFYLHPNNIPESIYPDNTRFSIPRPEQFTPINMRDWSNAPRFSAPPMHPPLTNSMDLLTQNWFPVESRAPQPSWSGSEVVFPNPSIGSGSGGGDQSLYSVLTQCSSLQPVVPAFGSMVGPPRNFAEDLGIGIPRTNPLPPPHTVSVSPFDYLSGVHHDIAPSTLKTGEMGWMNLHDSTGKPFPKSWNQ